LQAATTLIAARDCGKGVVDVDECIKLTAELYCRLTGMNWGLEGTAGEAAGEAFHPGSNRSNIGRANIGGITNRRWHEAPLRAHIIHAFGRSDPDHKPQNRKSGR